MPWIKLIQNPFIIQVNEIGLCRFDVLAFGFALSESSGLKKGISFKGVDQWFAALRKFLVTRGNLVIGI